METVFSVGQPQGYITRISGIWNRKELGCEKKTSHVAVTVRLFINPLPGYD
jgi:hypothetical protein